MKLCLALVTALAAVAPIEAAQIPDLITPAGIASYVSQPSVLRTGPDVLLIDWEVDLKQALANNEPGNAARLLAGKYGLPSVQMRRLIDLWLTAMIDRWQAAPDTPVGAKLSEGPAGPAPREPTGAGARRLDDCQHHCVRGDAGGPAVTFGVALVASFAALMHWDTFLSGDQAPGATAGSVALMPSVRGLSWVQACHRLLARNRSV